MAIMAKKNFIYMDVKELKPNPFDQIVSLNFDLKPLKVNTYGVKKKSILNSFITYKWSIIYMMCLKKIVAYYKRKHKKI